MPAAGAMNGPHDPELALRFRRSRVTAYRT